MKYKITEVTNSSSANFIITFKSNDDLEVEEFKDIFNEFLERHRSKFPDLRYWDATDVKKTGSRFFQVTEWTSMFNDQMDIPEYIRWLLIDSFLKGMIHYYDLGPAGLEVTNFEVRPDSEC